MSNWNASDNGLYGIKESYERHTVYATANLRVL